MKERPPPHQKLFSWGEYSTQYPKILRNFFVEWRVKFLKTEQRSYVPLTKLKTRGQTEKKETLIFPQLKTLLCHKTVSAF